MIHNNILLAYFNKPKVKESLTVFLDVDGVLNKESDWAIPFSLNNECFLTLSRIWKEFEKQHILRLVLISTWRSGREKEHNTDSYEYLESTLKRYGIKISDVIPLSNKGRQNEVEYYSKKKQCWKKHNN